MSLWADDMSVYMAGAKVYAMAQIRIGIQIRSFLHLAYARSYVTCLRLIGLWLRGVLGFQAGC